MANSNETTTKFKVDISELKKAMQDAKRQVAVTNSEFKAVASTMDDWEKSSKGLQAKLTQLDSNLKSQKTVLKALEAQYKQVAAEQGADSAAADRLKISINNQKAVINGIEKDINKYSDELKELGKNSKKAGEDAESSAGGFTVMKGALASLVADGIKVAIKGVAELGKATVNMIKESVAGYGEYEQLVGGIETLFKESQDKVMEYANDAYKTAGLSANEYMETVTSFSASLLQSLGGDTDKAADIANMALIDMADNANKMGTSMESIQSAYQGFAKQNYTMLDNLKLGYGGTKTEMERLLADAQKLSGVKYDMSNLADVYEAIHVVQTELGITGTTAKEASTTIQGSTAAMKSAWNNLIVGMADPTANFEQLISNVVDSATTVFGNLMPVVTQAIGGVGKLVAGLAPILAEQLPAIFEDVVPTLLESVSTLGSTLIDAVLSSAPTIISALLDVAKSIADSLPTTMLTILRAVGDFLPDLINMIGDMLPDIISDVVNTVDNIILAIIEAAPDILKAGIGMFTGLVKALPDIMDDLLSGLDDILIELSYGLIDAIPTMMEAGVEFFNAIVEALPQVIDSLVSALPSLVESIVDFLIEAVPELISGAITLLRAIIDAIPIILPALLDALPQIISTLVNGLIEAMPTLLEGAITLMMAIIDAIPEIVVALAEALPQIIDTIITTLVDNIPLLVKAAIDLFFGIVKAIPEAVKSIIKAMPTIIRAIVKGLKEGIEKIKDVGKNLVEGLWNGIKDMGTWIKDKIKGFGEGVVNGLKDFFGIHSPSKLMEKEIGRFIPEGIAVGIDKNAKSVFKSMKDLTAGTVGAINSNLAPVNVPAAAGAGNVTNFYQTINSPKSLSRLEIYRQSKNLLGYAGGGV